MTIPKEAIVAGIIGLVVGAGGMFLLGEWKGDHHGMRHMMPDGRMMHGAHMDMDGMMDSMMQSLEGKTGDALDEAFLKEMIVHHEGAVEMAKAVQESGAHAELKTMADAIISAQTAEIAQMKEWLSAWYGAE